MGWLFLSTLFSCKKYDNHFYFNSDILSKNKAYIIYRGTNTKEGIVAQSFNIRHPYASHIGIAINFENEWNVYHILAKKESDTSSFFIEEINVFFENEKSNLKYAGIWEISSLSNGEYTDLVKELQLKDNFSFNFDMQFNSDDPNKLYCSEFIRNKLHKINPRKFDIPLTRKKLDKFYKNVLKRDTLYYYPVDIFQENENFVLKKEWVFN